MVLEKSDMADNKFTFQWDHKLVLTKIKNVIVNVVCKSNIV